jgi:hypothetical protein
MSITSYKLNYSQLGIATHNMQIRSSQIPREQGRAGGRRVGEARVQQHGLRRLGGGAGGVAAGLEILDLGDFPRSWRHGGR